MDKETRATLCDPVGAPFAAWVPENAATIAAILHCPGEDDKVHATFGDLIQNITLRDGIQRMVADAKAKGPRQGKKFGHIEVPKNMPPAWQKLI